MSVPERWRPWAVPAALGALLAACASAGGGAPGAGPAEGREEASDPAAGSTMCRGDCSVRVENRLDVRVQIAADYPGTFSVLGVVREDRTEGIELPDFHGHQIELWIRDVDTQELVAHKCVRQFPGRRGRLVLGSGQNQGNC